MFSEIFVILNLIAFFRILTFKIQKYMNYINHIKNIRNKYDKLCAGIAGICSKTAVAPLDRIKILFQAQHEHYKHLGEKFFFSAIDSNNTEYPYANKYLKFCRRFLRIQGNCPTWKFSCFVQGQSHSNDQSHAIRSDTIYSVWTV